MIVHEIFVSRIGEGIHIGEAAIFFRLHGCRTNCSYCDTPKAKDLEGEKTEMSVNDAIVRIHDLRESTKIRIVVITGGEPAEQAPQVNDLCRELVARGFAVHLETNGTGKALNCAMFDYVCVSPKGSNLAIDKLQHSKDLEFKILYDVKDHQGSMSFINGIKQLLFQRLNYLPRMTVQLLDRGYSPVEMLAHYKTMAEKKDLMEYRILPQLHKLAGIK